MINANGLVKRFGNVIALQGVSLCMQEGDIYGLIGPNGAGKSTLFKILSTILRPDEGTAEICGIPLSKGSRIRSSIGYMPDIFGVYEDMTVGEYLEFFAAAYFIPKPKRRPLIDDVLALTDLGFKREAMVKTLSRGMQQRLGVARVLVHDPKVLILDEPASGLDPRARVELRELIKELRNLGKTILISSHILAELSEICNRVGIIEQGRMVFEGTKDELSDRLRGRAEIHIEIPRRTEEAETFLRERPDVESVEVKAAGFEIRLSEDSPGVEVLLDDLVHAKFPVTAFTPRTLSLEEAFMILTQGRLA